MVADHNGKKAMLGVASLATYVEWLQNRAFHIPPDAQRSLARGADARSTMDLLDDDKVHSTPRMKEVVAFLRHLIKTTAQGMNGEGFLGTVQLVVPAAFTAARFRPGAAADDDDPGVRTGVLIANTGRKEAAFYVGDGQGRLVGLHSLERDHEEQLDRIERRLRKLTKEGKDTTDALKERDAEKEFGVKITRFLSANYLPFVCYAGAIDDDGIVYGLDADAQRRLYIEGNAFNSAASKEDVVKYESFSPVIRRLIVLRDEVGFMAHEVIEEDSKSVGLNSNRVFTLSALTRAYSLSVIAADNPIKPSTDPVFEPVSSQAPFARRYWLKVQDLFGDKWTRPDTPAQSRLQYLQELRRTKTVYFSAIFLEALGLLGYKAGKACGWLEDADLGFLDSLAGIDYNPATNTDWQDLMMKKATKPDENGETGWVFNNVKDSGRKVFDYLDKRIPWPEPTAPNEE